MDKSWRREMWKQVEEDVEKVEGRRSGKSLSIKVNKKKNQTHDEEDYKNNGGKNTLKRRERERSERKQ